MIQVNFSPANNVVSDFYNIKPAGLQGVQNDNDNSDNLQSVTPVDEGLQNTNEGGN